MVVSASRRAPRPARVRPASGLDQERPAWRRRTLRRRWSRRRRIEATGIWWSGLLQCGASAFDALARLGQRLVRGGVRDAEIGRQAESLALDHGGAFRVEQIVDEIAISLQHFTLRRRLADHAS